MAPLLELASLLTEEERNSHPEFCTCGCGRDDPAPLTDAELEEMLGSERYREQVALLEAFQRECKAAPPNLEVAERIRKRDAELRAARDDELAARRRQRDKLRAELVSIQHGLPVHLYRDGEWSFDSGIATRVADPAPPEYVPTGDALRDALDALASAPTDNSGTLRSVTSDKRWCHVGRLAVSYGTGGIRHGPLGCGKVTCGVCRNWALQRDVLGPFLRAFANDLENMHRSVFSEDEWRNGKRARRLKETYPSFGRLAQADGDQVIHTPGPTEISEPITDYARTLVTDALGAPKVGKRRWTKPKIVSPEPKPTQPKDEPDKLSVRVPRDLSLQEEHDTVLNATGIQLGDPADDGTMQGRATEAEQLAAYRALQRTWKAEQAERRAYARKAAALMSKLNANS